MDKKQTNTKTDTGYAIFHDLVIHATTEKVFEAVSKPEQLVNWWPKSCSGTPVLGAEYNFYFGPEYDWYGKVSQLEPGRFFQIKMSKSDPDWDPTSFAFDIWEANGNTLLRFSHTGWPKCNEHFRTASFCWAILLKGLKDYVEKGEILPFEKRS